jgi:hypothetical protein
MVAVVAKAYCGTVQKSAQNSRFNPGLLRNQAGRNRREAEARLLRFNSPP